MDAKIKLTNDSSVNDFVQICDTVSNLMVSIFELQKQKFIYYSQSVDDILGLCPKKLKKGGWSMWYSLLNSSERPIIKHKISEFIKRESESRKNRCLLLKYHVSNGTENEIFVKHEVRFKRFAAGIAAVSYIQDRSEKERIENYLGKFQRQLSGFKSNINISNREKQVLRLIGCGLSSKQIANKLFISIHTVITHRKNLIKEFEVKNSAELIKEASRLFVL